MARPASSPGILPSTQYSCTGPTPLAYPVAVAQCNGNVFVASNGIDPFVVGGGVNDTGGTVDEVTSGGSLSALPLPSTGGGAGAGPLHPAAVACDAKGNVYVSTYFYIADGGFASNVNQFSPVTGGGWTTGTPVEWLFDQAYPALAVNPVNGDLYGLLAGQAGEGWLGTPMFSFGSIWDITKNATGITSNNTFNESPVPWPSIPTAISTLPWGRKVTHSPRMWTLCCRMARRRSSPAPAR